MEFDDIWQIKTSQVTSLKSEFDSLPSCRRCFQKNYQFTSGALSYKGVVKIKKPIDSDNSQDPFMDLYVPHGEVGCTTPNCLSFFDIIFDREANTWLKRDTDNEKLLWEKGKGFDNYEASRFWDQIEIKHSKEKQQKIINKWKSLDKATE